jgi:hypothetical protein
VNRPLSYNRTWPALLLLVLLSSCSGFGPSRPNRRITLWRKDKIPYGTFIAYESLPALFPGAEISVNKKSPSDLHNREKKTAYIIIVHRMDPDAEELSAILNFVGQGNHVFISAFRFGDSLLHALGLRQGLSSGAFNSRDSLRLSVYNPVSRDSLSFAYPGDAYDNWISSLDSQYTTILGRDVRGRPDLVRFNYKGGGTLYLQFAPMAFTNFFLLHKNNKAYYDNALSYLPSTVEEVVWDDYFRYDRSKEFSALQYILGSKNPGGDYSLRWAFWLLLLLFALIYLIDSKRKQRIVPVIGVVRNTSLDFVKTIGRLYYQRRDNQNLALKMVAHFQDHVRMRYNMPGTAMDEDFVTRLSYKTGFPSASLRVLVEYMKQLPAQRYVTDAELLEFQQKMDEFYKII